MYESSVDGMPKKPKPRIWWLAVRECGAALGFDELEAASDYALCNEGAVIRIVKVGEIDHE